MHNDIWSKWEYFKKLSLEFPRFDVGFEWSRDFIWKSYINEIIHTLTGLKMSCKQKQPTV